eukprot:6433-Heterococcus_DN1.PRE.3
MASARMQLLSKVAAVEGDLILLDGSVTVYDPSKTTENCMTHTNVRVTAITGAHSNVTLQDVVLPLIGSGVQLPTNAIGALYEQAIAEGKTQHNTPTAHISLVLISSSDIQLLAPIR